MKGKKILVRVDFNVPMDQTGQITDDSRIQESLPTIRYILSRGGSPILMSHMGRPKGKVTPHLSLAPCAKRLAEYLQIPVTMGQDCIGDAVERQASRLSPGQVLLLENLRFHPAETKPEADPSFVRSLANLGDCYVNDAFGTAHRAHSSTTTITQFFPGKTAPGLLLEKELKSLQQVIDNPERPFYALIGGAKVSSKMGVLQALSKRVDRLLIGGAMAYTFLQALGKEVGDSLVEKSFLSVARDLVLSTNKIVLPLDHVVVETIDSTAQSSVVSTDMGIGPGLKGVDIGPATLEMFSRELSSGKTVFWNGPMGVFEIPPFDRGTYGIATALAHAKGKVVAGGGDSVAAIRKAHLTHAFHHLSTGGGATLEYIEGKTLPALQALNG